MNEQGHCIIPPTDETLKQQLALKLLEYQARKAEKRDPYKHPELDHKINQGYRDACYKAYVLEAVLKSSEPVDTWKLSLELHKEWKNAFDVDDFSKACAVIDKYCGNLPNEPFVRAGTGLPDLPATEE